MKKINKKGFTLIELLAVIVLIALLGILGANVIVERLNKGRRDSFASTYNTIKKEIGNKIVMEEDADCTSGAGATNCEAKYDINGANYQLTITDDTTNEQYVIILVGKGSNGKIKLNSNQIKACEEATHGTCYGYVKDSKVPTITGSVKY